MVRQLCGCENVAIFHYSLAFFSEYLKSLLNAVLDQDGLICEDLVGWVGSTKIVMALTTFTYAI